MLQLVSDVVKKLLPLLDNEAQATFEAWLLIEKVTGQSRVSLLASRYNLTQKQLDDLSLLIFNRIEEHKPLAYILGDVFFAGISLKVCPPVLIPRPETEEMVLSVIKRLHHLAKQPLVVFDLCTGSGCIALALAHAFPVWRVIGVDISCDAIALAEENKRLLGLKNVEFKQASIFEDGLWQEPVNVIISNPPYVSRESEHLLSLDVLRWEDHDALFAPDNGNAFFERLSELAFKLALPSEEIPSLIVEFGVDQVDMQEYMLKRGFKRVVIERDISGISRWAECRI